MYGARSRSLSIVLAAAIVLLLLTVGLAFAKDQKQSEEAANSQPQAAPAATPQPAAEQAAPGHKRGHWMRTPANQAPPSGAPAQAQPPPRAPGARPQGGPPAQLGRQPHERPGQPAPGQPQAGAPQAPANGQGERSNPYLRRRPQPEEPQSAPERPRPAYRPQPAPPPANTGGRPAPQPRVTKPERGSQPAPERWSRPAQPERPQPPAPDNARERTTPRARKPVAAPKQENRRLTVPQATFRGPEADKRVNTVPAARQSQFERKLREQFRSTNQNWQPSKPGRLQRDVVGNPIPRDARFIQRTTTNRINLSYTRVETVLGHPAYNYTFIPRYPGDYWDGYWDGYTDGRRYLPHGPVVISFYYGYYWADPYWFGFYYPGYYPSVYHYLGYCPGWVYPNRVYFSPAEHVFVPVTPYRYYAPAWVDERGADRAIGDIQRAWFDNDVEKISRHLTDELDIQVYFDGEYCYTTTGEDYYGMTADALATTSTVDLDFNPPIFISSHEVFYTGRHVFYDPDGNRQTVYLSYRLRHLGVRWYIVAIGSSLDPIQHQYRDFRYH